MKKIWVVIIYCMILKNTYSETPLDWNAPKYHKNAKRQNFIALDILDKITIPQNASVLDVGCGNGKITHELARRINGNVVGLDISKAMITLAKETYGSTQNLSFIHNDIIKFFMDNAFDYVTSFFCLHWIQDKKTALQNMICALKKEGVLIIQATIDEDQPLIKAYNSAMKQSRWKKYFYDYKFPLHLVNYKECIEMLTDLGCTILSAQKYKPFNRFQSDAHLMEHFAALPIALNQLDPELHDDFLSDVVNAYKTIFPENQDGSINYLCPYIVLVARK